MKIHHLNCATMCPRFGRLVNEHRKLVCHCLVIESEAGLILVETGLGTEDIANPKRLGKPFLWSTNPSLDVSETAKAQIESLGFSAGDVKHIVVTHLDVDHAGGMGDFPGAQVHVHQSELDAAKARATRVERDRYVTAQWAHEPKWAPHEADGESWFGFERVRAVGGTDDEVLLIPTFGHTRGHCAVAVRTADKWLLHCGDAYFYHREVDPEDPHCSFGLRIFQRYVEIDRKQRLANQQRLRELMAEHAGEVLPFSAHDPTEFERLASAT